MELLIKDGFNSTDALMLIDDIANLDSNGQQELLLCCLNSFDSIYALMLINGDDLSQTKIQRDSKRYY